MPGAYLGGPIALVEAGATIHIDIPGGRIELAVLPEVRYARREARRLPERSARETASLLERYRRPVGPATEGSRLG